jgi:hypothetical protein
MNGPPGAGAIVLKSYAIITSSNPWAASTTRARGSTTLTPSESGQTSSRSRSPMLAATMSTS